MGRWRGQRANRARWLSYMYLSALRHRHGPTRYSRRTAVGHPADCFVDTLNRGARDMRSRRRFAVAQGVAVVAER